MDASLIRVQRVLDGELPDRPPLFDLIRNDAVLSYFAGEPLTVANAKELVYRVYPQIVDATRPQVRLPSEEGTVLRDDGRKERRFRWTTWVEPRVYVDTAAYVSAKRHVLDSFDPSWNQTENGNWQPISNGFAKNNSVWANCISFRARLDSG